MEGKWVFTSQRLNNNIDNKAFARVSLEKDSSWVQRDSQCVFADTHLQTGMRNWVQ
jgi:hypothetical protein